MGIAVEAQIWKGMQHVDVEITVLLLASIAYIVSLIQTVKFYLHWTAAETNEWVSPLSNNAAKH